MARTVWRGALPRHDGWTNMTQGQTRLRMLAGTAVLFVLLFGAGESRAQDSHYWTLQFGPRASLLGGAVIGSISDVSGTFYNPGALSVASDLSFALSLSVFERSSFRLEDGAGDGVDLGATRSGLRPSMVAGVIKRNLFGRGSVLAYSALSRAQGSHDLQAVSSLSGMEVPPDVDATHLVGLARFQGEFNDFWLGLTWSKPFGKHFGAGVTWYGAMRSQTERRETTVQQLSSDGSGTAVLNYQGGNFTAYRTLFKFGAFAQGGRFSGGLTVTTPGMHITGSGDVGQDVGAFGPDPAVLAYSTQTDLSSEYRSPLAAGVGMAVRLRNARLHGSVEWYDAVDRYVVMEGQPFMAQQPAVEQPAPLVIQEVDTVLNWALALEYPFTERFAAYAAYFTDDSALTDEVESDLNNLPIDIRTVNLGVDMTVGSARLTLGAGFAWGQEVDQELTELIQPVDEDFEATYVYRGFRFLFGVEFGVN